LCSFGVSLHPQSISFGSECVVSIVKRYSPSTTLWSFIVVKLPHYKNAAEGKFNQADAQIELKKYLDELCSLSSDMEQIHFQELVGLIEVLGELIIKSK